MSAPNPKVLRNVRDRTPHHTTPQNMQSSKRRGVRLVVELCSKANKLHNISLCATLSADTLRMGAKGALRTTSELMHKHPWLRT